jgi:hypothetical protein
MICVKGQKTTRLRLVFKSRRSRIPMRDGNGAAMQTGILSRTECVTYFTADS